MHSCPADMMSAPKPPPAAPHHTTAPSPTAEQSIGASAPRELLSGRPPQPLHAGRHEAQPLGRPSCKESALSSGRRQLWLPNVRRLSARLSGVLSAPKGDDPQMNLPTTLTPPHTRKHIRQGREDLTSNDEGSRREPEGRRKAAPNAPSGAPTRCLLDVAALAEQLGVRERFVRRLIAERRVPFCKIGKFIRFDPHEIEGWIDAQRVAAFEPD